MINNFQCSMSPDPLRYFLSALLLLLVVGLGWGWYQWQSLRGAVLDPQTMAVVAQPVADPDSLPPVDSARLTRWWRDAPFSVAAFQAPARRYHPWLRWWWPGLQVNELELIRELGALGEKGFGGVSVQLTTAGLAPADVHRVQATRLQADAPRLRHLLTLALREAHKRDMSLDWMSPLGWPLAGRDLPSAAQLQTLAFGEAHVRGGKRIRLALPPPDWPAAYYLNGLLSESYLAAEASLRFRPGEGTLLAVYAARVRDHQRHPLPPVLTDYLALDPDSLLPLNSFVRPGGQLDWPAPPGYWEIVAVYHLPTGQTPLWSLSRSPVAVADPFASDGMRRNVDQLVGSLPQDTLAFLDSAWRGLSFPAWAWQAEQAFSPALLDSFAAHMGYDLRPWLPALAMPGRDNLLVNQLDPQRRAAYRLTEADARVRHDYQRFKSDWLIEQGLAAQVRRSHAQGRLHRGRPFGADLDLIRAAGLSDVPTASQAFAGGSALFLKQITSGGQLYGRQLIACDALMHAGQAGAMSPQRLKRAADQLFLAGFNQLEWQGYAYELRDSVRYGEQGWHPFASPYFQAGAFSAQLGPPSSLWDHWPALNRYVARCQYALQQGEPGIDVLVYYPFLGFPPSWSAQHAHREAYFNGWMPGVADTVAAPWADWALPLWEPDCADPRVAWLQAVWPTLQVLESLGYTWAWANDEVLQQAQAEAGHLSVQGRRYGMVFLPEIETIPLPTLAQLVALHRAGLPVWLYGCTPKRQPGYANFAANDSLIRRLTRELQPALNPENAEDLRNLLLAAPPPQRLTYGGYYPFLRHVRRQLPDGSELRLLHNAGQKDRFFELNALGAYDQFYWLEPGTGACYPAEVNARGRIQGFLGGYESRLLYARRGGLLADSLLQPIPLLQAGPSLRDKLNELVISPWQVTARHPSLPNGRVMLRDTALFDWRTHPQLRGYPGEALYTHTFVLADTLPGRHFLLELGGVADMVEVRLNTHNLGTLLYPPFRLDVTDYLVPGANTLEIWVQPALRNHWVSRGRAGEAAYVPYASLPMLPAGLLGPVRLVELLDGKPIPSPQVP